MAKNNVQDVRITSRDRNKYSTAMRAAIAGRNAAADAHNMELYRLFDEAYDLSRIEWEDAQQRELEAI